MYAVCLKITQKVELYSRSSQTVDTLGSDIPLLLLGNKHRTYKHCFSHLQLINYIVQ